MLDELPSERDKRIARFRLAIKYRALGLTDMIAVEKFVDRAGYKHAAFRLMWLSFVPGVAWIYRRLVMRRVLRKKKKLKFHGSKI